MSSNVFFTADTHFGHNAIIKLCNRPFTSVEEMDERLIQEWNKVVPASGLVYHVGDFFFRTTPERASRIRRRLNGKIDLTLGNHDELALLLAGYSERPFESVQLYKEIKVNKQTIILFHYGMRTWRHAQRGTWHLYGHSHNLLPAFGKSFDVGVDCWQYRPLSFEEVEAEMSKRKTGEHEMFPGYEPKAYGDEPIMEVA